MKIKTCRDKKWAKIKKASWTFGEDSFHNIEVDLSLIDIEEIDAPMIVKHGYGDIYINKPGYKWLQVIPRETPYWFTSMFDDRGEFLQLYIDIVESIDFRDPQDPVMTDMYLDIIVERDLQLYLVDRDELEEALRRGEINAEQYNRARKAADDMMQWLSVNKENAVRQLEYWYNKLNDLPQANTEYR